MDSYDIVRKNIKRLLGFQKKTFDYLFNTMIQMQEQVDIMTVMMGLPLKNQVFVDQMHTTFKKNCDYMKNMVDGGFEKMDALISPPK